MTFSSGRELWARCRAGGQPRAGTAQVPDVHTGAASSMWPMRSRRTLSLVTSTPQRSQTIPLKRTRLYLPHAHSQAFWGPKIFSQNSPSFSGRRSGS